MFVMRGCPACFVAVPSAVRDHTDAEFTFIGMVRGKHRDRK